GLLDAPGPEALAVLLWRLRRLPVTARDCEHERYPGDETISHARHAPIKNEPRGPVNPILAQPPSARAITPPANSAKTQARGGYIRRSPAPLRPRRRARSRLLSSPPSA